MHEVRVHADRPLRAAEGVLLLAAGGRAQHVPPERGAAPSAAAALPDHEQPLPGQPQPRQQHRPLRIPHAQHVR